MHNLHTPERQPHETQADYRARQVASKTATRAATHSGQGQGKATSRQLQRDAARKNGRLHGTYGLGLVQPQRRRNQQRMALLHTLRDKHGAITLTGGRCQFMWVPYDPRWYQMAGSQDEWFGRRIWLAGISAQRGY